MGSVGTTLVGVLLLGLIFNILNFENGRGSISLSAYWQSVIRGAFLLIVVIVQSRRAFVVTVIAALVLTFIILLSSIDIIPSAIADRFSGVADYFGVFDVRGVKVDDANFAIVERMAHWQAAAEMFAGHPVLGVGAKHPAGTYTGTCSTAYCHSNGTATGRTTTYAPVNWGAQLDCEGCHPTSGLTAGHAAHISTLLTERKSTLSYSNYSVNASAGTVYKFGCANCHPVDITKHINGTVDIDVTTTAGSGTLKGKNPGTATYDMASTKKCSNVYCHSNGYATTLVYAQSPAWTGTFTGDKCAGCHGNSPSASGQIAGSAAHVKHVVGIHYKGLFNGTQGLLSQAPPVGNSTVNAAHGKANRSTTINCNICHNDTVQTSANDSNAACVTCHTSGNLKNPASLIANTSFHVNGQVNVKFAGIKMVSKAQIRDGDNNAPSPVDATRANGGTRGRAWPSPAGSRPGGGRQVGGDRVVDRLPDDA